jgi:hypothetical protein
LPKHIELGPKWKVGHGASGADIWVKDNKGNSLLIIECKTVGEEFKNAWKDTKEDGGQLFSYFQQEKSTQFVALYASDFAGNEIKFDYKLIAVRDDEEYLKSFGKKNVPNFKEATILRQHNVSGHENAFDKLIYLFLAKIVDEGQNTKELKFYWKGTVYDDVFSLIDRLQLLYKTGMGKETIAYIDNQDIEKAFRMFESKSDATKETIKKYFRELKFFTNNDFAFIDIHNERLFYQNAEVLLKIVKMLQDIKLQIKRKIRILCSNCRHRKRISPFKSSQSFDFYVWTGQY